MFEGSRSSDRASGESLPTGGVETHLKHYFYFECIDAAKAFSEMFRSRHVDASLDRSADGSSWGVCICTKEKITPERLDELRRGFEELVEGFEGEYDGWEYMPASPTKI